MLVMILHTVKEGGQYARQASEDVEDVEDLDMLFEEAVRSFRRAILFVNC
jgi:hypothetical protein